MKHLFTKSLSEKTILEVEATANTNYCSWERLKPFLNQACDLKPDERIVGIEIIESGVKIKIGKKLI